MPVVFIPKVELVPSQIGFAVAEMEHVCAKMGPVKTPIDKNSRKKSLYRIIRMKLKVRP